MGLFSKPGLFPWYARKPPGWSQLFLGSACKENFTQVIAKKRQRGQKSQKKPRYLGPLDDSWQERLADVVTPLWRLSYEEQLKVKFEAQKKILQRLEFYLQGLNGVNMTTTGPRSQGLCCFLQPVIPSVNTAGAEMLYRTVGELRGVNSNTILLNVCCGTGKWQPRAESACSLSP
ncbi:hypothetical protein MJG53_020236 [Ovis ammon polii x Ovis aries]|uniref:Uncharacterized protein n=3 Tax=Ovis TaxID=9935 RepID=A0A835ZGR6_SHEEP|nr:hypothetical protein JEQ12_020598 [Ovis aries]KAI4544866.1 hypothetical protein MG293_005132 [Ovis ammon polii]KAI4554937.1 hypothetical protein MJG53_020236 [Ovis ammon polii x Ovis aries]